MSARLRPPPLIDHLRACGPDELAQLLLRRPDLSQPDPCRNLDELAERAQEPASIRDALAGVTLPEDLVLQLMVCCRPGASLLDLAAALPEGTSLDDIEPVLASLEAAALVWRRDGHIHTPDALRDVMPTSLGPPLAMLVAGQTVGDLKHEIANIRHSLEAAGFDGSLPPRALRADAKPAQRTDYVAELEALLTTPRVVSALLSVAPDEAASLAVALVEHGGAIATDLYLSPHRHATSGFRTRITPQQWLFERALLMPMQGRGIGFQPREVGVSLLGGRPIPDLHLAMPELVSGSIDQDEVDRLGALTAVTAVEQLADLLDHLAATPEKELKSGGLGVSTLKRLASQLDVDTERVARLLELLHLAGLLRRTSETTKSGRTYTTTDFVEPGPAAKAWLRRPPTEQWRQITVAWWRAWFWPSASGRKDRYDRAVPVLDEQFATDAVDRRRDVIATLAALPDGERTSVESLTPFLFWRRPRQWHDSEVATYPECVAWIMAEAELLGVVAHGRLTGFGAALTVGRPRGKPSELLAAALPGESKTFTLLPDLTVIVVGRLSRDTMTTLRLMADIESIGAATTLRFSDASLRRALDAGYSADDIVTFLTDHADKGVPRPLSYLVTDLGRRHGHLMVSAATAVVTSDDPAVLADACSHRRTRKLGLRLVAPTVAICNHPPDKVLDALRVAGFLPKLDDGVLKLEPNAADRAFSEPVDDDKPSHRVSGPPAVDEKHAELPEPYRQDNRPRMHFGFPTPPSPLSPDEAEQLASALFSPRRKASR